MPVSPNNHKLNPREREIEINEISINLNLTNGEGIEDSSNNGK